MPLKRSIGLTGGPSTGVIIPPEIVLPPPPVPPCGEIAFATGTGSVASVNVPDLTDYSVAVYIIMDGLITSDYGSPGTWIPQGGFATRFPVISTSIFCDAWSIKQAGESMPAGTISSTLDGSCNWLMWVYGCKDLLYTRPFSNPYIMATTYPYPPLHTHCIDYNSLVGPNRFENDWVPRDKWMCILIGEGGTGFESWAGEVRTIRQGAHGGFSYALGDGGPTMTNMGGCLATSGCIGAGWFGTNPTAL